MASNCRIGERPQCSCVCVCCCSFAISQHPEVEEKVVAELAEHGLLATGDNPNPRTLAYPDLGKLTYLQAVIKVCPSTCSRSLQLLDAA